MQKVVLAGNAVTAEILWSYLQADDRYQVVGATVDDDFVAAGKLGEVESVALSQLKDHFDPANVVIIMAMGYNDLNRTRQAMYAQLKDMGYHIETYIHPDSKVFDISAIGEGSVILPNAVVEPLASIAENSMIWSNVTIAHHSRIGANCWIAAGGVVSGHATVSDNSFIGVNATIVNEVVVGSFNIIGAAAMISKSTASQTVHLARSAEPFRCSSDEYVKFFGV